MFMQIYNETIRDLLDDTVNQDKHDIKQGPNQQMVVTNVAEVPVTTEDQVSTVWFAMGS